MQRHGCRRADLVRIKLVNDIQNWDGSLSFHKDSILAADPASAEALVLSRAAVRLRTRPARATQPRAASDKQRSH